MEREFVSAVQRTFDLQIPCTCSQPAFCERYHGLPMATTEFVALLPSHRASMERTERLLVAYYAAKTGEERVDAFRRLTAPFNSY